MARRKRSKTWLVRILKAVARTLRTLPKVVFSSTLSQQQLLKDPKIKMEKRAKSGQTMKVTKVPKVRRSRRRKRLCWVRGSARVPWTEPKNSLIIEELKRSL